MRILEVSNQYELKQLMCGIDVDPYGIKIMAPKGIGHVLKLNSISNISANIPKQEMLSLGGDAAVARGVLTGKTKKTDCLLMGNLSQLGRLNEKLKKQPFGLSAVARELSNCLNNYQLDNFTLGLYRHRLNLSRHTCIMGIVNITPDSFSADGLYDLSVQDIIRRAKELVSDGADIIDVGGESSQPGAKAVSVKEELKRAIPVIRALAKKIKVPVSIDTYKPEVARQALDCGAEIVNDITGLKNPAMLKIIARYNAACVIMHMKGNPRTMQKNPQYRSLMDDILAYLGEAVKRAEEAGIKSNRIVIDPGLGFGKTAEHNFEILKRLKEFKVLGKPILAGASRKSFIGKVLDAGPKDRIFGTVAACVLAAQNGAKILRVHDVKEVRQALKILNTINN